MQWADAHDRFVTSIAGGTTPDVAETGTTWTAEFADAGALAPIGDYVADAGLDGDLVEGLVESGTYDDELYGMPWYAGVRSLVYRADIFEELGLEAPTTWDEIVAAGEAIKAAHPDMMPFAVPGDAEFRVYPWVWGAGGEVATQEGDEWVSGLDSAESQEGIDFYTGLATEARLLVGRRHHVEGDRRARQLRAGQRRHGPDGFVDSGRDPREERRPRGQVRRDADPRPGRRHRPVGARRLAPLDVRDGREQGPRLEVRRAHDDRRVRRAVGRAVGLLPRPGVAARRDHGVG